MTNATEPAGRSRWLPLFAIASHAAGDFPLQSDRMAAEKFDSRPVRAAHVATYTLAFVPTVIAAGWGPRRSLAFFTTLATSHFTIDSRRWAEQREGFKTRPVWFDQALHLIALAIAVGVVERV